MKLRINVAFTDKNTKEKYGVGDVKEFADDRAKELLADKRNLVSSIEEAPAETVEEPDQEPVNEEAPAEETPKTKKSKK